MLRMFTWTLRPGHCAWVAEERGGWHLGEHDGSSSFSPQLELNKAFVICLKLSVYVRFLTYNPQHGSLWWNATDKIFQYGHTSFF